MEKTVLDKLFFPFTITIKNPVRHGNEGINKEKSVNSFIHYSALSNEPRENKIITFSLIAPHKDLSGIGDAL